MLCAAKAHGATAGSDRKSAAPDASSNSLCSQFKRFIDCDAELARHSRSPPADGFPRSAPLLPALGAGAAAALFEGKFPSGWAEFWQRRCSSDTHGALDRGSAAWLVASNALSMPLTVVSHLASQSASSKAAAGEGKCAEAKVTDLKSADLLSAQRLRLHLVGAAEYECDNALVFEELLHLLPNLTTLSLCLIGPSLPAARLQAERAPWMDAVTAQYAPRDGDDRPLVVREGVGARSDGSPLLASTYEGLLWPCARPLRRCVLRAPCSVRVCVVLVVDRVVTCFVRQLCLPCLFCSVVGAVRRVPPAQEAAAAAPAQVRVARVARGAGCAAGRR